ncbi:MAG: YceI family protein [Actinomycetota bacterium]
MTSTTTAEQDRKIGGHELPAPGTWTADPAHSSVEVVAKHMMVTKVRGRVGEVSITAEIDADPTKSSVVAILKAGTLSTSNEQRDGHLMSEDFLDVERFPEITFRSRSLEHIAGDRWKASGDLSIRDITRPVDLDIEFGGVVRSPFGHDVAVFSATGVVHREDFGMTWNQTLETGGVLVSKTAKVEIEAQLVRSE